MMTDREKLFVIMQKISDVAVRNNDIPIEKASKKATQLLEGIRRTQFISISYDEMDKMYSDLVDLMDSQVCAGRIILAKLKENKK